MIGRSTTSARAGGCSARAVTRLAAALLLLALAAGPLAAGPAQSGRRRERPARPVPAPQPTPPPSTSGPAPASTPVAPTPAIAEGAKVAEQDDEGAEYRFVLRNGLTLVVSENHSRPLAALVTHVRAGAFDEPAERPGLAAFAARSLLRGTATRPGSTAERQTRALGGMLRAAVESEATELTTVVPSKSFGAALEIQADLLLNPAFDPEQLRREQLALSRDGRRLLDDPESASLARLVGTAFAVHPLRRRSVELEAPATFAREQLVEFYRAHYRPDQTILVASGDVSAFGVLADVQRLYGTFGAPKETAAAEAAPAGSRAPAASQTAPRPIASAAGAGEPQQTALRYGHARGDIGQALITIGYHAPPMADEDAAAVDLLAVALGRGQASRLARTLRPAGLLSSVESGYVGFSSIGLLTVQLAVDPQRLDAAEAAYFREVDRFRRERVSDGELQRAGNTFEREFLERSETVDGTASVLARFEALFGDFRAAARHLARVRAVTSADLQRVAARYLLASRASVFEYLPPQAPARTFTAEQYGATVLTWAPTAAREVAPGDVRAGEPIPVVAEGRERRRQGVVGEAVLTPAPVPVRDFSVLNGPRAFVREDQSRPLAAIGLFFAGGRLGESPADRGLTELMVRCLARGARGGANDPVLLLEQLGARVQAVNESDFFGLSVDVPSRNAEGAMRLLIELVESPVFDKVLVEREREVLLADQQRARDSGLRRSLDLFRRGQHPGHPYGWPALGIPETVSKLTDERVRAWYTSTVRIQYPLVGIVGDTDGSSLVSRYVAEGFERAVEDATIQVPVPAPVSAPTEVVEQRGRALTVQAVGFPAPRGMGGALDALDVVGALIELRLAEGARESSAADARVLVERRRFGGAVVASVVTRPENETEARDLTLREFARAAATSLTAEELEYGRGAVAGAHSIRLQGHVARLLEYTATLYGASTADTVDTYEDRVRALTADDARRAAADSFLPSRAGRGVLRGR